MEQRDRVRRQRPERLGDDLRRVDLTFPAAGQHIRHGPLDHGAAEPGGGRDQPRIGEYLVGARPVALAFDGTNIWVACYHDGTVVKLRASDGALRAVYNVGGYPRSLAFDGDNVWVANEVQLVRLPSQ